MITHQDADRQITLLAGFDAVFEFLFARWKRGGEQSEELADLLSWMDRYNWANGQPMDIAQWFDWLDAVLLVRPDMDDVRKVRQQVKAEWDEFRCITGDQIDAVLTAERQAELDTHRAKVSQYTWHRIGDRPIGVLDAYKAMNSFLVAFWDHGLKQWRDIEAVLDDLKQEEPAAQAALWSAWLAAVRKAKPQSGGLN